MKGMVNYMTWEMEPGRPIYIQIIDKISTQIVSGQYAPGEKLPSVREFAAIANVNPNTMQRAFIELEQSGLVVTQRTAGRTVTEDMELIRQARKNLAKKQLKEFVSKMHELGYEETDIKELFHQGLE